MRADTSKATRAIVGMAPDISSMPAFVALAAGADHCQPIVSCDHSATPTARNVLSATPRVANPAWPGRRTDRTPQACRSGLADLAYTPATTSLPPA